MARLDRLIALPAAAGLVFWLKGVAIAAGVAVSAVSVVSAAQIIRGDRGTARHEPTDPRSRSPARAPTKAAAAPAAQPTVVESPPPSAAPHITPIPPAPPPAAAPSVVTPPGDPLAREAAMLEDARAMLDRAPAETLSKLDAHAAAFPTGVLAPERELMAVEALRRLGLFAAARARGEKLMASPNGSLYGERVRAMLAKIPEAGP